MSWAPNQDEFDQAQLVTFLRAVDRNFADPLTVVAIGGSAAMLGYGSSVRTSDIDVFETSGKDFERLAEASVIAREETGLLVGVERVVLADIPDSYCDRLREVKISRLANLTFAVPDKYDLALSKAVRCWPHDVEAVTGIHDRYPLALATLVERFEKELLPIANVDRKFSQTWLAC